MALLRLYVAVDEAVDFETRKWKLCVTRSNLEIQQVRLYKWSYMTEA
jgi:hypothetical protein